MKASLIRIIGAVLAASFFATLCAGCAQGGTAPDGSSNVPTGSIKAYGVIDEGIAVSR